MKNLKNKKILIPFISLIVLIMLLIFLLLFFNIPRVRYKLDKDTNEYSVVGCYGNAKTYTIKDNINGIKVTSIGVRAFYNKTNLEEIIFENKENIELIDRLAFSKCYKLAYIELDCVDEIERNAFSYCTLLKNVTLSAKYINSSAFYASGLESVTLNEGVKTIGSLAFSKTNISEVNLPSTISRLYQDCFNDMSSLKKITTTSENIYNKLLELEYNRDDIEIVKVD